MNILSLFDGMSCGQIALRNLGIKVDNYYASEIDKWAIQIALKNFPNTVQMGDVTKVRGQDLPQIDLMMAGSPCQGFSSSGKGLAFDDPRSKLFFEFVRLLEEVKPRYFLLENVRMKKEWEDVITDTVGVDPIKLNSALVSAQNRIRLYWTNIPQTPIEDKRLLLQDIVQKEANEKSTWSHLRNNKRVYGVTANEKGFRPFQNDKRKSGISELGRISVLDSKSSAITTSHPPKITLVPSKNTKDVGDIPWRKLTVTECERLQTVPDGYTKGISDRQRYKMLGNGWTVALISELLKEIKT